MSIFLGIDAGTTSMKAALFSADGRQLAMDRQEYTLETPAPGMVELDPVIYWHALSLAIRRVLADSGVQPEEVAALAISSQGETLISVDAAGRPVAKAIVWLDNRATAEAADLADRLDPEESYRRTGQPEITPTWPACKILWIRRHRPDVDAATAHYLLLADYLFFRLTGRYVTERSLQTSSLLLDIQTGQWWQPTLDLLGLSPERLPELLGSGEAVGPLSAEAAAELGLTTRTVAVTGAMDQVAGAVGAGNIAPGPVSETTGGALAIVATVEHPTFDPGHRVPCHVHAAPGMYCLLPWSQTAGMALRWFRDAFYPLETRQALADGLDPYDMMTAEAAQIPPGAGDLIMLPHLEGAACPEFDPTARAVFCGATLRHGRGHFVRAILEAVAYMLRRNLLLVQELGVPVREVRSLGGGARSPLWLQIKADVLQKPVLTTESEEVACLGAALLAALATEHFASLERAVADMVHLRSPIEPNPSYAAVYQAGCARYGELYQCLAPFFRGSTTATG